MPGKLFPSIDPSASIHKRATMDPDKHWVSSASGRGVEGVITLRYRQSSEVGNISSAPGKMQPCLPVQGSLVSIRYCSPLFDHQLVNVWAFQV
uniref:Uncharacterized protein n=1 Tax=Ditylenchus dipsaci TaxID=166011 RepID=A0A915CTM3_9BILA